MGGGGFLGDLGGGLLPLEGEGGLLNFSFLVFIFLLDSMDWAARPGGGGISLFLMDFSLLMLPWPWGLPCLNPDFFMMEGRPFLEFFMGETLPAGIEIPAGWEKFGGISMACLSCMN